jgi:hypothetical protein
VCVDELYPKYSRFVRGFKHPKTEREKKFTEWQEARVEKILNVLLVFYKADGSVCRDLSSN